jgi:hypothetical protein
MGRTKGSKNKSQNTNTAKNKNIININVNSSTKKKGRGRPRRTNDTSPNRNFSGGGIGNAPQQVIVSQPQPDNNNSNNSLLSSFITSKLLNDTMSLNRTNIEQTAPIREQQTFFNARESIIPRFPDTPVKNVINEVKPSESTGPPPPPAPPAPPLPPKTAAQKPNLTNLSGMAAVLEEIKYNQSEEGQAEKARKKAEAAAKKESKKLEKETTPPKSTTKEAAKKETAPPQSTADFLNMSFTPPKKDIVEMMTPQKEKESTALTPYKGQQSTLDFLIGGTPQKTPQQLKTEKKIARIKELKHSPKVKDIFEYNDLKSEMTSQPNPNKNIAGSIIGAAIKRKAASQIVKNIKEKPIKTIQAIYRGNKERNKLANDKDFQNKIDMKIKKYGDAASEYKTRGADAPDINKEFSDIMKTMRTGLQKYKTTLGTQPKKRGPKPKNPYDGLKQTEL